MYYKITRKGVDRVLFPTDECRQEMLLSNLTGVCV